MAGTAETDGDTVATGTDVEEHGFEERADQLTDEQILTGTSVEDYFDDVQRALLARGLVLLVGPRGCGKTHMMRYASLVCRDDRRSPFALYVSFNRYLRLEPLLGVRVDAVNLFHGWVLARILLAAQVALEGTGSNAGHELLKVVGVAQSELDQYVSRTERGLSPSELDERVAARLTISSVAEAIRAGAALAGRKRSVVLLDDAALTLAPEFLVEFFDVVRVLKAPDIALKASVYPGTTEYGPRFHTQHEGRTVPVWLSVTDERYERIMSDIARNRYPESRAIAADVDRTLMYAAFGVPRAYLTLLREWMLQRSSTEQATLNKIIQEHREARVAEYRSLALKLPKLGTLVRTGETLLRSMLDTLVDANRSDAAETQLLVGVATASFEPMSNRMINLLIEAGLVREESEVSHGHDRKYRRFAPHVGALIAARAFGRGRAGGARIVAEAFERPFAKHPVRRSLDRLVDRAELDGLRIDLPPCQECRTERMSDTQRFCHVCGNKLLNESTYSGCMKIPILEVPGLSVWARKRIVQNGFNTIGDLMAVQDPGSALRLIKYMGKVRSGRTLDTINEFVDEFLS